MSGDTLGYFWGKHRALLSMLFICLCSERGASPTDSWDLVAAQGKGLCPGHSQNTHVQLPLTNVTLNRTAVPGLIQPLAGHYRDFLWSHHTRFLTIPVLRSGRRGKDDFPPPLQRQVHLKLRRYLKVSHYP